MHGCEHDGHLSWEHARRRARELGECLPAPVRELPLDRAIGGVLARDVRALAGLPAFDASAMDGYAVAGPGPWRLVGRRLAGSSGPSVALRSGETVEIATGARIPKGAESVLPYEQARLEDTPGSGVTRVRGEVEHGRHVRWSGEETAPGETVLTRGHRVGPASLGIAASLGHETLPVFAPAVAIVVTGDEITRSGLPGDGRVRDAIGPILPGIADWAGAQVGPVRYLGDDRAALAKVMTEGDTDVVVVCGSSSKGPADHVRSILAEAGAETVVDGVQCRPGHPQLLARLTKAGAGGSVGSNGPGGPGGHHGSGDPMNTEARGGPETSGEGKEAGDTIVVGLPGNPGAAMVAALTLFTPLVSALAGRPDPARVDGRVPASGQIASHPRDTRLVAVRLDERGRAVPVGHDRPGSLRGAALADAYAVVPPGWSAAAGETGADGEDVVGAGDRAHTNADTGTDGVELVRLP
ncbi:molybdopterin molybdotransferase MoeA [Nocardiopsis xinjiangensis]|uniref:molybdopterin molybdotransferase MoeA n=1 Tax=Nocardiopsis xinjiangensis TaxID=124285 RepID=UPI00034DB89D|nr:molybdopterin molybdotransferase MoeA [Nocardiopsis xinjiangensis]